MDGVELKKFTRNKAHIMFVRIISAEDINSGSGIFGSTSNAYVILNTIQKVQGNSQVSADVNGLNDGTCVAFSRSKTISSSVNPEWNDEIQISMKGEGFLTLTIMSSNSLIGDNFLGQVVVDLSLYPNIYEGANLVLELPIEGLKATVHGTDAPVVSDSNQEVRGSLKFSLYVPLLESGNMCGNVTHSLHLLS